MEIKFFTLSVFEGILPENFMKCSKNYWQPLIQKNNGDELGMEIRRLRDEKQAQASRQNLKTRIDAMMRFINDLLCKLFYRVAGFFCKYRLVNINKLIFH